MDTQEKILFNELKNHKLKSFELLFESYYKLLTTQAFYYLEDIMEAEDVVQNLFITIWEKQAHVNIQVSIKSYLQVAVRNRCFTILEKRKINLKKEEDYKSSDCLDKYDLLPWEHEEGEHKINNLLKGLSPKQFEAFNLVHLEDKRYKDAANIMGISVNSIKTHLKTAVKLVKKKLETSNYQYQVFLEY